MIRIMSEIRATYFDYCQSGLAIGFAMARKCAIGSAIATAIVATTATESSCSSSY